MTKRDFCHSCVVYKRHLCEKAWLMLAIVISKWKKFLLISFGLTRKCLGIKGLMVQRNELSRPDKLVLANTLVVCVCMFVCIFNKKLVSGISSIEDSDSQFDVIALICSWF